MTPLGDNENPWRMARSQKLTVDRVRVQVNEYVVTSATGPRFYADIIDLDGAQVGAVDALTRDDLHRCLPQAVRLFVASLRLRTPASTRRGSARSRR